MNKFESPLLTEVGLVGAVVLAKVEPLVDDSSGSQASTVSVSALDLD